MRTFKIYSLNNFQVCNTECNTATMLYITSSGLIYWKCVLFNHLYPFCPPLTSCFWQPPMFSVSRLLLLSHFSRVRLCATHRWQPTRLRRPWDSPGKNTGVGCHFLLQHMKVKSESEVAQSCLTLCDPMDWSPSGSSIYGIFQARVLEWGAITFSAVSRSSF